MVDAMTLDRSDDIAIMMPVEQAEILLLMIGIAEESGLESLAQRGKEPSEKFVQSYAFFRRRVVEALLPPIDLT